MFEGTHGMVEAMLDNSHMPQLPGAKVTTVFSKEYELYLVFVLIARTLMW